MAKFIKACKCPRCGKICKSDGTTYDLITEGNAILLNDFSLVMKNGIVMNVILILEHVQLKVS